MFDSYDRYSFLELEEQLMNAHLDPIVSKCGHSDAEPDRVESHDYCIQVV